MDLPEFFLVFTMLWNLTQGLRCYNCVPVHEVYKNEHLCEHFDYSDKYIVECPNSTMCRKKATLWNGVTVFTRGCAKQTMAGDQMRTDKGWVPVSRVYEVYEESCQEEPSKGRDTKTTNCYCRGDLCNTASTLQRSVILGVIAVVLVCIFR